MERQAEAERRKRAEILQSEGERESAINLSQGKKQAVILQAQVRSLSDDPIGLYLGIYFREKLKL